MYFKTKGCLQYVYMRCMEDRGGWWFLHLIQRPQYISPWSKIYQLTLLTSLYNKKCDRKYLVSWIGLDRAFQGVNEGKERGSVSLHAQGYQYIVNRCAINITKQGKSQLGLQSSQNATTARGLTRGHIDLQIATHQWKEDPSVVRGVYMDYIGVVWDTVMVGKISTRGTGRKAIKNMKNKEETYQSVQSDILEQ